MKGRVFYIVLLFSLFVFIGCGNTDKQNEEQNENVEEKAQNEGKNENEAKENIKISKANTQTIQAKFDKLVPGTDGAIYIFRDENGKTYQFYSVNETEGLEFTTNIDPLNPTNEFDNVWFKVTYEKRELEFFDGGTGENVKRNELVIIKAERLDAQSTSRASITAADLTNAIFFGTEPNWTIKFYDNYVQYEPMGKAKEKLIYISASGKSGNNSIEDVLQTVSDNAIAITVKSPKGKAEITVKKEACNDGMSDNSYPYSITLKTKGQSAKKGCGRIKN